MCGLCLPLKLQRLGECTSHNVILNTSPNIVSLWSKTCMAILLQVSNAGSQQDTHHNNLIRRVQVEHKLIHMTIDILQVGLYFCCHQFLG